MNFLKFSWSGKFYICQGKVREFQNPVAVATMLYMTCILGTLDFKSSEICGTQLLFLEHSLAGWTTRILEKRKELLRIKIHHFANDQFQVNFG